MQLDLKKEISLKRANRREEYIVAEKNLKRRIANMADEQIIALSVGDEDTVAVDLSSLFNEPKPISVIAKRLFANGEAKQIIEEEVEKSGEELYITKTSTIGTYVLSTHVSLCNNMFRYSTKMADWASFTISLVTAIAIFFSGMITELASAFGISGKYLNFISMWHYANVVVPTGVDRILSYVANFAVPVALFVSCFVFLIMFPAVSSLMSERQKNDKKRLSMNTMLLSSLIAIAIIIAIGTQFIGPEVAKYGALVGTLTFKGLGQIGIVHCLNGSTVVRIAGGRIVPNFWLIMRGLVYLIVPFLILFVIWLTQKMKWSDFVSDDKVYRKALGFKDGSKGKKDE